jgi:hypothetical protein
LRWSLDHIFHSKELTLIEIKRLPYFGSDHFPIFTALHLEPGAGKHHEEPQSDAADMRETEATIAAAKED